MCDKEEINQVKYNDVIKRLIRNENVKKCNHSKLSSIYYKISRIICSYTQFKRSNTFIYLKSFKIHYVHYLVPRAEDDEKFGFSQHQN